MISSDDSSLLRERVNLRTVLVAVLAAAGGILLLYISSLTDLWGTHDAWRTVAQQVGGLLVVTVAITVLWELAGKRAFAEEVLAKAGVAKELTFSGITRVTDSFHSEIDWETYFKSVQKLDIFFAYGRTWRNTHIRDLQDVAGRSGARIRVVLPDPEDPDVVRELSRRFSSAPDQIVERIREAEDFFRQLSSPKRGRRAEISIWYLPATPQFSFYRFDRVAILALYTHRPERAPVPTFVCEMGGTLYDYVRSEFGAMIDNGLARALDLPPSDGGADVSEPPNLRNADRSDA